MGGPVTRYLQHLLPDEKNTVLLTGYQSPGTVGHQLQSLAGVPIATRELLGGNLCCKDTQLSMKPVRAEIRKAHGYSGHADQHGLLDFLRRRGRKRTIWTAPTAFLTHGSADARRDLAVALEASALQGQKEAVKVELPADECGWYDLDRGERKTEELESGAVAGQTVSKVSVVSRPGMRFQHESTCRPVD